jgi:hypothetical protein
MMYAVSMPFFARLIAATMYAFGADDDRELPTVWDKFMFGFYDAVDGISLKESGGIAGMGFVTGSYSWLYKFILGISLGFYELAKDKQAEKIGDEFRQAKAEYDFEQFAAKYMYVRPVSTESKAVKLMQFMPGPAPQLTNTMVRASDYVNTMFQRYASSNEKLQPLIDEANTPYDIAWMTIGTGAQIVGTFWPNIFTPMYENIAAKNYYKQRSNSEFEGLGGPWDKGAYKTKEMDRLEEKQIEEIWNKILEKTKNK